MKIKFTTDCIKKWLNGHEKGMNVLGRGAVERSKSASTVAAQQPLRPGAAQKALPSNATRGCFVSIAALKTFPANSCTAAAFLRQPVESASLQPGTTAASLRRYYSISLNHKNSMQTIAQFKKLITFSQENLRIPG